MDLYKILMSEDIVNSIRDNYDCLIKIIPEINDMVGFEHKHPHHHLDVWEHTLLALSMSHNDFVIRLSLLLHDIGKPHSCIEGEVRHFYKHPQASCYISYKILKRLGYEDDFINKVCCLILKHDTPIEENDIKNNYELCKLLYQIQYCDALAHAPDKLEKRKMYLKKIEKRLYDK